MGRLHPLLRPCWQHLCQGNKGILPAIYPARIHTKLPGTMERDKTTTPAMAKMNTNLSCIPILAFLEYEIHASWWARHISHPVLQGWAGSYYAWKAERKYRRYRQSLNNRAKYISHAHRYPPPQNEQRTKQKRSTGGVPGSNPGVC